MKVEELRAALEQARKDRERREQVQRRNAIERERQAAERAATPKRCKGGSS